MERLVILSISVLILVLFFLPIEKDVFLKPMNASDSDGKFSHDIISSQENFTYVLLLKTFPYGFMKIHKWENPGDVEDASIITEWKTNGFGAGNVYIEYSLGGENFTSGPFNESEGTTYTIFNVNTTGHDLEDVKYVFRGEDLDFGVDAIAWIRVKMAVKKQVYGIMSLI